MEFLSRGRSFRSEFTRETDEDPALTHRRKREEEWNGTERERVGNGEHYIIVTLKPLRVIWAGTRTYRDDFNLNSELQKAEIRRILEQNENDFIRGWHRSQSK